MNINTKTSKIIIIILGLILLISLVVVGINTYLKEKEEESAPISTVSPIFFDDTMEIAENESNRCLTEAFHGLYRICCEITQGDKKGLFFNCTSEEYQKYYFEPGQLVLIRFNPLADPFLKTPYFLGVYSDLNGPILLDIAGNSVPFKVPYAFNDETPFLMQLVGKIPENLEQNSDALTLLRIDIYPDDTFNFDDAYSLLDLSIPISILKH